MADLEIILNPNDADRNAVRLGLIEFNRRAAGRDAGWQPIAIHLLDPATGGPVGGLTGAAVFDWFFVELLHIPEALRGKGHGRALMNRAEQFAREQGCVGIWLDTFSFQARPFYEKLGFTVFGTLDDHPIGGARYFMQKRFEAPAA
jgi:GNAT superfamily N-acetyltransferase